MKRRDCRVSNIVSEVWHVKWHSGPVSLLAAIIAAAKSQKGSAGPPWDWPVHPQQNSLWALQHLWLIPSKQQRFSCPGWKEKMPCSDLPRTGFVLSWGDSSTELGHCRRKDNATPPSKQPCRAIPAVLWRVRGEGCEERFPPQQLPLTHHSADKTHNTPTQLRTELAM